MASELAIDIAEARYELAVHQHVAGKLDVLPDFPSRLANLVLREFPLLILRSSLVSGRPSRCTLVEDVVHAGGCRLEGGDAQGLLIWRSFCARLGTGILSGWN